MPLPRNCPPHDPAYQYITAPPTDVDKVVDPLPQIAAGAAVITGVLTVPSDTVVVPQPTDQQPVEGTYALE